MKAVRLYEYGEPENLKFEVDVPEPTLGADSVLVEAAAASVNPIDWKIRSGARQKDFPLALPAILGRDVSGVVRAVGSNIRTFKPGDRVIAFAQATYAELVVVEGSLLTHLPEEVNLVDAAAIPLWGKRVIIGAKKSIQNVLWSQNVYPLFYNATIAK